MAILRHVALALKALSAEPNRHPGQKPRKAKFYA